MNFNTRTFSCVLLQNERSFLKNVCAKVIFSGKVGFGMAPLGLYKNAHY